MAQENERVEIIRGSDHAIRAELKTKDGPAFDLSGADPILAAFPLNSGSVGTVSTESGVNGIIEIIDPDQLGAVMITLNAAFTATLKIGQRQSFEVKVVKDSKTYKVQFREKLDVLASTT